MGLTTGRIFRFDDVSPNTDFEELYKMFKVIKERFPKSRIISGINVLAKENAKGSVYPFPPFKHKEMDWFFNVNVFDNFKHRKLYEKASHGLFHFDHSNVPYEYQKFSIEVSCKILHTNVFIPPFNRYNEDTEFICKSAGIELIKDKGWRSIDYNSFDYRYKRWYLHPRRWTGESLNEYFKNSENVGLIQRSAASCT